MNYWPGCEAELGANLARLQTPMAIPKTMLWIVGWQAAFTLLFAAVAGAVEGRHALLSVLFGGGIAVLANTAYAWRSTRCILDESSKKIYRAQLWAEVLKFTITVILFGLVFARYREVLGLPLFIAYLSTYAVFWLALLRKG